MADKLLTLSELADKYGVPRKTLVTWDSRGQIHAAFKQDGNKYYDDKSEEFVNRLKQWKPRRKNTPAAETAVDATPPATAEPVTTDTESAIVDETTDATAETTAEPAATDTTVENTPSTDTTPAQIETADATADDKAIETADAEPVTADNTVENALEGDFTAAETVPAVVDVAESISLNERATRIQKLLNDIRANCISIGFELIAAKKLVNHGDWGKWLADNFSADYGLSVRTAQNYISVAERFGGDDFARIEHSKLILMTKLPENTEKNFLSEQITRYGKSVSEQSWRQVKKHVEEFNRACHGTTPAQIETADATADTPPAQIETAEPVTTDTESADIENLQRIIADLQAKNDALRRENDRLKAELAARDTAAE